MGVFRCVFACVFISAYRCGGVQREPVQGKRPRTCCVLLCNGGYLYKASHGPPELETILEVCAMSNSINRVHLGLLCVPALLFKGRPGKVPDK